MKLLGEFFLKSSIVLLLVYVGICVVIYFIQEQILFYPQKLSPDYKYNFESATEEIFIEAGDKNKLHGLLLKADSSKGLVFYLHGNGGATDSWGGIAPYYNTNHYDLFVFDYRGYGKSEGKIQNEKQFYSDVQAAYDHLKNRYSEDKIVVIGYSVGTGAAAWLASRNAPKLLVLKAPYFSMLDMKHRNYPFLPDFLLKYKFRTDEFIQKAKMPVVIFHGNRDEVIPYESSVKLSSLLKKEDRFITLPDQSHNGINENLLYRVELAEILK